MSLELQTTPEDPYHEEDSRKSYTISTIIKLLQDK